MIFAPTVMRYDEPGNGFAGGKLALLIDGQDIVCDETTSTITMATVTSTGFTVTTAHDTNYYYTPALNYLDAVYSYIAFK